MGIYEMAFSFGCSKPECTHNGPHTNEGSSDKLRRVIDIASDFGFPRKSYA